MKTKNIKNIIIWSAVIGISAIVLFCGLAICIKDKFDFSPFVGTIDIFFDLCAMLIAIIGIYIAYRIQVDIADMNEKNHISQDFFNKLNIYISSVDKLNRTYKSHVENSHEKSSIIASANMLSTQAIMVYYALKDLIGSKEYTAQYVSNTTIKNSVNSIESTLTHLSDIALIEMNGIDSFKSDILKLVIQLNDENADFQREIYAIRYPKTGKLESRTI